MNHPHTSVTDLVHLPFDEAFARVFQQASEDRAKLIASGGHPFQKNASGRYGAVTLNTLNKCIEVSKGCATPKEMEEVIYQNYLEHMQRVQKNVS
jgi:hypothetical protein